MSPDSVVKNTVLQPGISEFFSEAGDGEEPVIVQSKILESLKSLGFGKELEDDYSATVFSSSIKVVQPQIVISFGSDFNSTGFNGRPTLSKPQLNPQNRTMVSNPTGRFVQAMPKVSESDSFSINRNGGRSRPIGCGPLPSPPVSIPCARSYFLSWLPGIPCRICRIFRQASLAVAAATLSSRAPASARSAIVASCSLCV